MSINFRADTLEAAIHDYGLTLPEDVKWDNEKMIKALGDFFMTLTPERYSWNAKYVQSLCTPMLCRHLKEEIKNFNLLCGNRRQYGKRNSQSRARDNVYPPRGNVYTEQDDSYSRCKNRVQQIYLK